MPRTRVVVIDDHALFIDFVRALGPKHGLDVVAWATSAAEGVAAAAAHQPDIVLVDYMLPDGTGAEVARRLRELTPAAKVVMLTGAAPGRAMFEALEAGCAGYVVKTSGAAALLDALTAVAAGATVFPPEAARELRRLDQFEVRYQPVVALATGTVVGVEAVVRWPDLPNGPAGSPELSAALLPSRWRALSVVAAQVAQWRRELPDAEAIWVSIETPSEQLCQPDAVTRIGETAQRARLLPAGLVLQVSDAAATDDVLGSQLEALSKLGIALQTAEPEGGALSFASLLRLPFGAVKLRASLIEGVTGTEATMARAAVRLAHDLGVRVVVDGVGRPEQLVELRALECELGQGDLWSSPLPADDFPCWYTEHRRVAARASGGRSDEQLARAAAGIITYAHCGCCHRRGAYGVPRRPVLRCKYCQASISLPTYGDELDGAEIARLARGLADNPSGRWRAVAHPACSECLLPEA